METSQEPGIIRYVLGFLAVGFAWGFTTPFMRRAALQRRPRPSKPEDPNASWARKKLLAFWSGLLDFILRPSYTIPLVVNLSGSAMFFLIVGKADLSLAVPITNSVAFLFTVLGEWLAEAKSISRDTWLGMVFVLSGIAICVHSKTSEAQPA